MKFAACGRLQAHFVRRLRISITDVIGNGAGKQCRLLAGHSQSPRAAPPASNRAHSRRQLDFRPSRHTSVWNQAGQRRFSATCAADDGSRPLAALFKGDVRAGSFTWVCKRNVVISKWPRSAWRVAGCTAVECSARPQALLQSALRRPAPSER